MLNIPKNQVAEYNSTVDKKPRSQRHLIEFPHNARIYGYRAGGGASLPQAPFPPPVPNWHVRAGLLLSF
jgi:hypothetical protein